MLTIRKAEKTEYEAVRAVYHCLIDAMQTAAYRPGWKKDIYPSPADLQAALAAGTLYVGTVDDRIVCAMVADHACNAEYQQAAWPTAAEPTEVTVIHMLGVHPDFTGRGYAKAMVRYAVDLARRTGQKVLRLDVLAGNRPASRLYAGLGFAYVENIRMFYEDTGWTEFELYEYPVV